MTAAINRAALAILMLALPLIPGCASVWQRTYHGSRADSPTPATDNVVLRSVPWERVDGVLAELHKQVVESDTHPDEWPTEKIQTAKAKLLTAIQVSQSPEQVVLLGSCMFRTTDTVDPTSASGRSELISFAREIGADMVVWSSRSYGTVTRTVQHPITTFSSGTDWHRGRNHPTSFSETTTTWIPVRVELEELGFVAYFLRQKPSE
ncbi:MAG: hypothetical protein AB7G11_08685 [Phycisphaerales bacterium]